MKKICFVIGSKDYASAALPDLLGCEPDANNIFDALIDPSLGAHDEEESRLLISPTLEEVRSTFDEIYEENTDIDVFTFVFSGHGAVKTGNLFLCMKNTVFDRLSTTAFPLSYLFTILNEVAPRQTNIIIDACEAGGVVFDLRHIINPELLGAKETPGVSILASAASDQNAKEKPDGGYASTALLQCLRGEVRVQAHRPYLNLIEVGNCVSKIVSDTVHDQTPVVWGLNLFGDSFLANNPHFEGDAPPYSYGLAQIPAGSEIGQVLQNESSHLWEIYQNLPERTEFRSLLNAIHQPCGKLGAEKGVVSSFVRGLSQSIPSHAANQNDVFAEAQAYACCVVALLAFLDVDEEAEDTIHGLNTQLSDLLQSTLEKSYEALVKDPFAILSTRGGTNDLFFYPFAFPKF